MKVVPLAAQPSQNLQIVLAQQNCQITVRNFSGYDLTDPTYSTPKVYLGFDLVVNGNPITSTALCLNQKRMLINRQYLGVVGDFMFIDTQGDMDPEYSGLGTRYFLLYLEAADLPT